MPCTLNYYPHYHRDWLSSSTTRRMSYAARGIYRELMDYQWEDESLPASPEETRRLLGCSLDEWKQFAPWFDRCFPIGEDGQRRNARMAIDREAAATKVATNQVNGAKGGRPRKTEAKPKTESEPKTRAKPSGSVSETKGSTEPEPIPETDSDSPPPIPRQMARPTREQVNAYRKEIGLPSDEGRAFWDYYESNGWKVGRNPMRNWQAALRSWKQRGTERQAPKPPTSPPHETVSQEVICR